MEARSLGKSGIQVSPMGMGCWAIGGQFWLEDKADGWGQVDDNESIRSIRRALEMGVNFFDTADVYGTGHSESVLGLALEGRRDQAVIATKFGYTFDAATKRANGQDSSPAYIRKALEASLKRLKTDYIDLYQLHIWALPADQAEEVAETLEAIRREGLIRAYGWSTDDPDCARLFAAKPNCASIQHDFNLFRNAAELIDICEKAGVASLNRSPLAMGMLTGKFNASSQLPDDDVRGSGHGWVAYFKDGKPLPEFLARLEAVREILTSEGRTLVQGALAWIWGRSGQTIPIPGFKNLRQVEENVGAMAFGPLKSEQMAEIERLLVR